MKTKNYTQFLVCFLFIFTSSTLFAQDSTSVNQPPKKWKHTGQVGINFSNVGLVNWSGGGESSYSFGGILNYKAVRETDRAITRLYTDLAFGLINQANSRFPFKKTDDQLNLGADYSYKWHKKVLFTAAADFRTQFAKGYEYVNDDLGVEQEVQISDFLAPGYLNLNIGLTYNPAKYAYFTFSPLANRMTFVRDTIFSERYGLDAGQQFRDQLGMNFKAGFDKEVVKNVTLKTVYNMFAEYSRLTEWVVNWDLTLDMKVNKFLNVNFTSQLIYDPDVIVARNDGTEGQAVQFKHALNVGLVYRLGAFKE
ncbi:DUF3078 domain-containing protein [Flammeovirga aprica]|uniref:DUF3078 domain-containing protein n=1 Tax=Flammeovirga aprica JL-4 TaxID=694437 RepID=A0A7X9XB37_9BACT|nr:DUF3078 domain-containing protein [Flammeovirga aprica]NME70243.1 DUF3078 domain-containing protein [Flammeovirga aprica JL-4]